MPYEPELSRSRIEHLKSHVRQTDREDKRMRTKKVDVKPFDEKTLDGAPNHRYLMKTQDGMDKEISIEGKEVDLRGEGIEVLIKHNTGVGGKPSFTWTETNLESGIRVIETVPISANFSLSQRKPKE